MKERSRIVSANDLHVAMTQFLNAAQSIHVAMCRLDDDSIIQGTLNDAMHSALIGMEQMRRLHASEKRYLVPPGAERDSTDDAPPPSQAGFVP